MTPEEAGKLVLLQGQVAAKVVEEFVKECVHGEDIKQKPTSRFDYQTGRWVDGGEPETAHPTNTSREFALQFRYKAGEGSFELSVKGSCQETPSSADTKSPEEECHKRL